MAKPLILCSLTRPMLLHGSRRMLLNLKICWAVLKKVAGSHENASVLTVGAPRRRGRATPMEGLFNERLQVRTRHLEERVGALSKQLAAHKEDNARLHKSHSDATHKVQSLEGELKSARERCHKLSATLASCRRNEKNKILRSEEGDYDNYDSDSASSCLPGNAISHHQCMQCGSAAPFHHGTPKNGQNYQLLPNYMGIMPARLNHKLMNSKRMNKSNPNHHKIAYPDGQVHLRRLRPSIDMGNQYHYCSCDQTSDHDIIRCADCCCNVEVFLAQRLHLNDHAQQECSSRSLLASHTFTSKRQNQNPHMPSLPVTQLHQPIACKYKCCLPVRKQKPLDQTRVISTSTTSKAPANAKVVEQDLQSLITLSAEGFYVRMESAKADCQQQHEGPATSCKFDSRADHGDEHIVGGDYYDFWSMEYMQALKAENEALRGALLSSKKVEIQELESELQDIKQCASGATISSIKKGNSSSDRSVTESNDHVNASNGLKVRPMGLN